MVKELTNEPEAAQPPPILGWRWWTREIFAISAWLLIIAGPLVSPYIDKDILNRIVALLTIQNVTISVFVILGISWLIGLRTMWHIAFIVAYPLIVPLRILPRVCIRHWPILFVFLPGIRGLVRGMRLRAGLLCIAIAATLAAFNLEQQASLVCCWIILCACLTWTFAHQLYMAYRPATAYSELVDVLQRVSSWLPSPKELAKKLKRPSSQPEEAKVDEDRSKAANLFILYGVSTALQRSFKLDIYLVWCIAKAFVLTVVTFTIIFASMAWADSNHFKVDGSAGFVDWLMFSFCNLMTSDVSGIAPVSAIARRFATIELFFAFGLLVLFVFVVFTSLRERHRTDLQIVVSKFQAASSAISDVFETDFDLTQKAVEGIMMGFAPSVAKHLIALQHGNAYAEQLYSESKQTKSSLPSDDKAIDTQISS